jgi:diacylglycerol kinase (ATP)
MRKVRVLINPNSGLSVNLSRVLNVLGRHWDREGIDLSYQVSQTKEDGVRKARNAVADGVDTVLVVGGDGMINTIGGELVGTDAALGVIPGGSGNGFARHFSIPLDWEQAAQSLANAERVCIDVAFVNERPFFVTCSMAWDAALLRTFETFPFRGILPYALSAVYEYFEYSPHTVELQLDGGTPFRVKNPLVLTAANLTQFGGGAQIAPRARPDDGKLELVIIARKDLAKVLASIHRLFDGTLDQVSEVKTHSFSRLRAERDQPGPIQIDGELIESVDRIDIAVRRRALHVLVPREG